MEKDADKKLDAILDAIKGLDARITKIEAGAGGGKTTTSASAKKISIREFLLKHSPTTDVQRTLAVGYYLEKHEGVGSFTRADLERATATPSIVCRLT